jgi:hypothetical protein
MFILGGQYIFKGQKNMLSRVLIDRMNPPHGLNGSLVAKRKTKKKIIIISLGHRHLLKLEKSIFIQKLATRCAVRF